MASCNAQHFSLHDAALDVEAAPSAVVDVGDCRASASIPIGAGASYWFVEVKGCGVDGMVGVNLR